MIQEQPCCPSLAGQNPGYFLGAGDDPGTQAEEGDFRGLTAGDTPLGKQPVPKRWARLNTLGSSCVWSTMVSDTGEGGRETSGPLTEESGMSGVWLDCVTEGLARIPQVRSCWVPASQSGFATLLSDLA